MSEDQLAEQIAKELRRGATLESIHQLFLINEPTNIVKWLHPDLSINLFQLSILNERFDILQYLALHYPSYLHCDPMYKATKQYSDIEDENMLLNSPLHLACLVGNLDIIRFLFDHKTPEMLSSISMVNLSLDDERGFSNWRKVKRVEVRTGKPFEFCVFSGNIECIDYLLTNHIIQCLALRFLYAGVREPSSLLHKACSVGNAPMIELLLERSFKDVLSLCDKNGKTPLHIASWNGDTASIKLLLENGASVNCVTESRTCLHILYRSKLNPYNYVQNTQLFLTYGINFQEVDKNGKTLLHILAEEIGISMFDAMCYWQKASEAIKEMTVTYSPQVFYTAHDYKEDLLTCLKLLLEKGIDPNRVSYKSGGNQSPMEVLLQYSSLRYSSSTLRVNPEIVYDGLELLLKYGANPNAETHVTNLSLFNHFLVNHLVDIGKGMKEKFINLFCQYGANPDVPDCLLDHPLSPVVSVMEGLEVLSSSHVLLNYMSLSSYQRILRLLPVQIIPRLLINKENRRRNTQDLDEKEFDQYLSSLKQLVVEQGMRSLKHTCKLVILTSLNRKGELVHKLPLPAFIKKYLTSSSF